LEFFGECDFGEEICGNVCWLLDLRLMWRVVVLEHTDTPVITIINPGGDGVVA